MAWLSKLHSTYLLKVLRENIYFLKLNKISTFFGLWDEKNGSFSQKVFFQCSTNKNSRFRRNISKKKDFSFEKVFFFCCHFWSLSDAFVLLQNCLVRCAKSPIIVQRGNIGKKSLENLFFLFNFWTLSGKNLDFQQNSKAWFSETQPKCADELLQKIFWKQKFLYECFRSMNGNIGFPAKMISQGFQRRSSRVQCNTLRKRW